MKYININKKELSLINDEKYLINICKIFDVPYELYTSTGRENKKNIIPDSSNTIEKKMPVIPAKDIRTEGTCEEKNNSSDQQFES